MKKLFEKTVSISENNEIGLPFGKSYYERTPKTWRIIGDALMTAAGAVTIIGAVVALPPLIPVIGALALLAGKFITNCVSAK